jgi:hypothetical protein
MTSEPRIAPAWPDPRLFVVPPVPSFTISMASHQAPSVASPQNSPAVTSVSHASPVDSSTSSSFTSLSTFSPLSTTDSLQSSDLPQSSHLSLLGSANKQQHDTYILGDGSYVPSDYRHLSACLESDICCDSSPQHGLGIDNMPYEAPSPLEPFQALGVDLLPPHPRSELVISELSTTSSSISPAAESTIIDHKAITAYHSQVYAYHFPYIFNGYDTSSCPFYSAPDPAPAFECSTSVSCDTLLDELDSDFVEMASYLHFPSSDAPEGIHNKNMFLPNFSKKTIDARCDFTQTPLTHLPAELAEAHENPFEVQMGIAVAQALSHKSFF